MLTMLLKQTSIKATGNEMNIAGEPACFDNSYVHDYRLFSASYGLRCNS